MWKPHSHLSRKKWISRPSVFGVTTLPLEIDVSFLNTSIQDDVFSLRVAVFVCLFVCLFVCFKKGIIARSILLSVLESLPVIASSICDRLSLSWKHSFILYVVLYCIGRRLLFLALDI